jgi:hypothetical protein
MHTTGPVVKRFERVPWRVKKNGPQWRARAVGCFFARLPACLLPAGMEENARSSARFHASREGQKKHDDLALLVRQSLRITGGI